MRATVVVASLLTGMLACQQPPPPQPPGINRDLELSLRMATHAAELDILQLDERLMRLQLGDATVNLAERCQAQPPHQPANQLRCQQAAAKIERWRQAQAAQEAKEKAEW